MIDTIYEGEIYDGDPEEGLRPGSNGPHDDSPGLLRTLANVQNNVSQTLEWYRDNHDDPPFDPDGMCLKICRTARNIPARYPSAKVAQDETPAEQRVYDVSEIRKGMVVYYDTVGDSNPYGHIVTVAGRAPDSDPNSLSSLIVWTNSVVRDKIVAVRGDYFVKHWNDKYQFASTWLNGVELSFPSPPAPPKPVPAVETIDVDIAHLSLEVFDTPKQIEEDLHRLFKRQYRRGAWWFTGTEAFGPKVTEPLRRIAADFGYLVYTQAGCDSWVAIRKVRAHSRPQKHWEKIVEGEEAHRDLGVFAVEFDNDDIGHVTVISNHLLTAKQPGASEKNRRVNRAIGRFAREQGFGKRLVCLGSDQNVDDRFEDTFDGVPFTSVQDEEKDWEDTRDRRTIDVIATYDPDGRVSSGSVRVLDDQEFPLHSDHRLLEARLRVRAL